MKKGRSPQLVEKRNRKLVERYYFWTEVERRRFDDTLVILEQQEFFISQSTIMRILSQNYDYLGELRENKINPNQLKLF